MKRYREDPTDDEPAPRHALRATYDNLVAQRTAISERINATLPRFRELNRMCMKKYPDCNANGLDPDVIEHEDVRARLEALQEEGRDLEVRIERVQHQLAAPAASALPVESERERKQRLALSVAASIHPSMIRRLRSASKSSARQEIHPATSNQDLAVFSLMLDLRTLEEERHDEETVTIPDVTQRLEQLYDEAIQTYFVEENFDEDDALIRDYRSQVDLEHFLLKRREMREIEILEKQTRLRRMLGKAATPQDLNEGIDYQWFRGYGGDDDEDEGYGDGLGLQNQDVYDEVILLPDGQLN